MSTMDNKWVLLSTAFAFGALSSYVFQYFFKKPTLSVAQPPAPMEDDVSDTDSESEIEDFTPQKMVLVVRKDLKMSKGKTVAQCCHATLGAYKRSMKYNPGGLKQWEYGGQAKVTVQVENETQLLMLQEKAQRSGLVSYLVIDAGKTQIASGSRTVLAIGPDEVDFVDQLTRNLRLL